MDNGHFAWYEKVTLYEDNAGGLYIHREGEDVAYCVPGDAGQFVADALALAQRQTADWTCETTPIADVIAHAQAVDVWHDGVYSDEGDGILAQPGRTAREYIGLTD